MPCSVSQNDMMEKQCMVVSRVEGGTMALQNGSSLSVCTETLEALSVHVPTTAHSPCRGTPQVGHTLHQRHHTWLMSWVQKQPPVCSRWCLLTPTLLTSLPKQQHGDPWVCLIIKVFSARHSPREPQN